MRADRGILRTLDANVVDDPFLDLDAQDAAGQRLRGDEGGGEDITLVARPRRDPVAQRRQFRGGQRPGGKVLDDVGEIAGGQRDQIVEHDRPDIIAGLVEDGVVDRDRSDLEFHRARFDPRDHALALLLGGVGPIERILRMERLAQEQDKAGRSDLKRVFHASGFVIAGVACIRSG